MAHRWIRTLQIGKRQLRSVSPQIPAACTEYNVSGGRNLTEEFASGVIISPIAVHVDAVPGVGGELS